MKITIVSASEGKCLELAEQFKKCIIQKGCNVDLINLVDLNLPLYTSRAELSLAPQEIVAPFKDRIEADGYVFLAPEYNGGIPGALSNFLAWVSRSTKNWRDTFNNKVVAIGTHSGGGQNILQMMRLQLSYIGMNVLGRQIHTNPNKPLIEADLNSVCEELVRFCGK